MGQNVIADALGVAQAAAVADHEPAVRTDDGQMVRDVLGVGGTDADVDQRHAFAIGRGQMIRRHLVALPLAGGDDAVGLLRRLVAREFEIARQDEMREGRGRGQLRAAPAQELVDVAVVVGEQDPVLHVAPVAAGVVHDAAQRIVDSDGVEQREGTRGARRVVPEAVRDLVADEGEARHGKMTGEVRGCDVGLVQLFGALEHVGVGNFLIALLHLEGDGIVLLQGVQLLEQVVAECMRVRDGRLVDAFAMQPAEGAPVHGLGSGAAAVDDAQEGVAELAALGGGGGMTGFEKAVERGDEGFGCAGVEALETLDGGLGGLHGLRRSLRHGVRCSRSLRHPQAYTLRVATPESPAAWRGSSHLQRLLAS